MNKRPNQQVKVTGCNDCLLLTSNDDGLTCAADDNVNVPRNPHDADEAAQALPTDCPLWKHSIVIGIDHRWSAEPEGKD